MRRRGYDIDSPRGGGKSRIADEAGVHRAAVTRLLQRQSMPDLETTRRLARVLGVPVRDMLDPLRPPHRGGTPGAAGALRRAAAPGPGGPGAPPDLEGLAEALGVPAERRDMFVKVVEQFLPAPVAEGRAAGPATGRRAPG